MTHDRDDVAGRGSAPAPVGAVILAAGASRRAGATNKLLHEIEGEPMVRRVVRTTLEAGIRPCIVVLGHEPARVRGVLGDLSVSLVVNEAHEQGMGTSIGRGIEAMAATEAMAAFVVLGDMPWLRAEDLQTLVATYRQGPEELIVAPEAGPGTTRRLGNPVLWPRRYFARLGQLRGDRGAREILRASPQAVRRVPIEHPGVLRDLDTL